MKREKINMNFFHFLFLLLLILRLINLDLEFIRVIIRLIECCWVYNINHLIFKNHYMTS